jgi:hypothetical protein
VALTLALGIGANAAIFSVVRAVQALATFGRGSFASATAKTRTAIPFNYPIAEIPIIVECSYESI